MDQWQRAHIFNELERNGHQITVFNPLHYKKTEEANIKLINYIKAQNKEFNLFMTPYGSVDLYPETLEKIKKMCIPTLLICFDNLIVPYKHSDIAYKYDLVWLTSKETKYLFEKFKANTIFLPYAANPYILKPNHDNNEILKIVFVGNPYGSRVNMINYLLDNELNVDLYFNKNKNDTKVKSILPNVKFKDAINLMKIPIGRRVILGAIKQKVQGSPPLKITSDKLEWKGSVNIQQLASLYSKYALSLSSTAARNTGVLKKPVDIVNLRSFEIPMSRGIQICSYTQELSEYFEENKEILFYRSNQELIDKAKFYLKPDKENLRLKIRENSRKRAINDHTWSIRFNAIFEKLGLKVK